VVARSASVQLRGGEIRAADLCDLAGLHEIIHRTERVRDRDRRIGLMQLIEIDAVDAEPLQTVVAGAADVLRSRPFTCIVHRHTELGRDDRLLPPTGERAAEEFLALRRTVDVSGVEEVDTGVERRGDDTRGRGLVNPHPEVVAAKSDERDAERTDRSRTLSRKIPRTNRM
jgi:hypothetical protein